MAGIYGSDQGLVHELGIVCLRELLPPMTGVVSAILSCGAFALSYMTEGKCPGIVPGQ
jgi:hypothetical protein